MKSQKCSPGLLALALPEHPKLYQPGLAPSASSVKFPLLHLFPRPTTGFVGGSELAGAVGDIVAPLRMGEPLLSQPQKPLEEEAEGL